VLQPFQELLKRVIILWAVVFKIERSDGSDVVNLFNFSEEIYPKYALQKESGLPGYIFITKICNIACKRLAYLNVSAAIALLEMR